MKPHQLRSPRLLVPAAGVSVLLFVACSSSTKSAAPTLECSASPDAWCSAATCSSPGGPAPGPPDSHCGDLVQPTSEAVCEWDGGGVDPAPRNMRTPARASMREGARVRHPTLGRMLPWSTMGPAEAPTPPPSTATRATTTTANTTSPGRRPLSAKRPPSPSP